MKTIDDKIQIYKERDYPVKKANEIIQRAKLDLNLTEQKIFLYAVSKIKPDDKALQTYEFSINDFCDVCGIARNDGRTIENIKEYIRGLKAKPFWMINEDRDWETIDWIAKAWVTPKSGKIKIRFDETMHRYLINMLGNFTQFSLLGVLPMRSTYSIRLYELLRSYAGLHKKIFEIDELKALLMAPYVNFKDFRRKVLEIAEREINAYTDIEITWEPIAKGRKVVQVEFTIELLDSWGKLQNANIANGVLDGQMELQMDGSIIEINLSKPKKVQRIKAKPQQKNEVQHEDSEFDETTTEAIQELERPQNYKVKDESLELKNSKPVRTTDDVDVSYDERILNYMKALSNTLGKEQFEKLMKALESADK